ncbi:MAG TPA: hypothetical protein VJO34_16400 [Methylomirabilota bacterium]|nr:hypothetical protein [Methylomirabilota bacterium]
MLVHRIFRCVGVALLGVLTGTSSAQEPPTSPYRQYQAPEIRGLSQQEIEDLREGRGMGLARAAELNSYPGPRHLLDAVEAGQLHLDKEQLSAVKRLFGEMSAEAKRLGDVILKEEQALEASFREGKISDADLKAQVSRIASFQGELRLVHLRTHLETRALLSDPQIQRYNQVRGYSENQADRGQHSH